MTFHPKVVLWLVSLFIVCFERKRVFRQSKKNDLSTTVRSLFTTSCGRVQTLAKDLTVFSQGGLYAFEKSFAFEPQPKKTKQRNILDISFDVN